MSFRRRVVLLAAGAVAAAVVIASVVVYFVTRDELVAQIDSSLQRKPPSVAFTGISPNELAKLRDEGKVPPNVKIVSTRKHLPDGETEEQVGVQLRDGTVVHGSVRVTAPVAGGGHGPTHPSSTGESTIAPQTLGAAERGQQYFVERGPFSAAAPGPAELQRIGSKARLAIPVPTLGGATGYVQLSSRNGPTVHSGKLGPLLPVTGKARAVAAGTHPAFYSNATVDGTSVRVFTEQAGKDAVWQAALPLTDLNSTLAHLRLVLALVCLGGIALAGGLGLLVSRAALVPVRRLTGAAEEVTRTQDLGHRIEDGEGDELGRLAGSFNTMLAALEDARLAQRQLVSDASHELRTPLTSVRANLDALADERLPPGERTRVVAAVQAQLGELTVLVSDLVDLSKGELAPAEVEDVRLDLAASTAVERAGLHAPASSFSLDVEPCLVRAAPARLDRAIANLLDNACSWNPPGGPPIEVRVRDGVLQVRDHGPGIAAEDLPHVFDRFYRAAVARAQPGSGLGLAIVRQVADMHDGSVRAENDPGGGARLALRLPALAMSEAELAGCAAALDRAGLHDAPRSLSGDSQVADA